VNDDVEEVILAAYGGTACYPARTLSCEVLRSGVHENHP
jgi:hypothetical protein